MLEMAGKLINKVTEGNPFKSIEFRRFLSLHLQAPTYDLTVAAFSLGDLPDDGVRRSTVKALWKQTKEVLVLVERGTPDGSRIIANARTQILSAAGYLDKGDDTDPTSIGSQKDELHIVAPCSHEKMCPMVGSWCHFAQRIELTPFHHELKSLGRGFVDQKFSYIVIRRGPRPPSSNTVEEDSFTWPRIIRRPLKRAGHVINDVCHADGTFKRIIIPKSQGKQIYYDARKSKWGDLWPHPPKNTPIPIETMKVKVKRHRRLHRDDDQDE